RTSVAACEQRHLRLRRVEQADTMPGSREVTVSTRTDVKHPLFARLYPRMQRTAAKRGETAHRTRMLEGLHGRVVEVGAGHGANCPLYPTTVTEVVAVEPEPRLRADAERAASKAPVPITVVP